MALTREQLIQNINAMEAQGAPQGDIQAYINTQGQPAQPQQEQAPNFFDFGAAKDVFTRLGDDISTAQQADKSLPVEARVQGAGLSGPTILLGGALSIPEALGAGFFGSHQGRGIAEGAVSGLTKAGDFLTAGEGVRESIGGFAQEVISGFQGMSPEEQLKQRNRLRVADLLTVVFGGKAIKPAIIDPLTSGAKTVASKVDDAIPTRKTPTQQEATTQLTRAYEKAFVSDKPAVNKALAKEADRASFGGKIVTANQLIQDLVGQGVFPKVRGKLADFTEAIGRVSDDQAKIGQSINQILSTRVEQTPLVDILNDARIVLANTPSLDVTLDSAIRELDKFGAGLNRKFQSGSVTPVEANQIRINMNAKTKAFRAADFSQDTADAIADAVRKRLDEIEPRVREANREYGRLAQVKRTATVFQFKPIDVGVFGSQIGRLGAVTLAGLTGVSAGLGPGGLVVAGIIAHFGGEAVANLLRKRAFSPKAQKVIIDSLRKNPDIAQELINDAKGADKAFLARKLLPAPKETEPIEF